MPIPREKFKMILKSAKMLTKDVRHLEFCRVDGKKLDFIPGQFITFHFTMDNENYSRSYSISSIPTQTKNIEMAVSPFEGGPGTRLLFGIKPGDAIETTGPFGRLILRDEQPKRYILVATGTGVTPYRAMLPSLVKRIEETGMEVVILFGVRTPNDLFYGEDFLDFSQANPNLKFHAYYSRELPERPKEYEHKGYVQTAFPELKTNPESDIVYLCGNPNMVDEAFEYLQEKGFETRNVRREKYISPK